jgi:hypothetical protein
MKLRSWGLQTLLLPTIAFAQSGFLSDFDHFTIGFPLYSAYITADCESCYVGAVFQGTPLDCAGSCRKSTPEHSVRRRSW